MLDRLTLAACLEQLSEKLFPDVVSTLALAVSVFQRIAKDPTFSERARNAESSFLVPSWVGQLGDVVAYNSLKEYAVLAVDGSQVYPDRHISGAGCFLLNIGGARFSYNAASSVSLFSIPEVCPFADFSAKNELISPEIVDLLRESRELAFATAHARHLREKDSLVLIDGTIIFWMLEGKSPEVHKRFIDEYVSYLNNFYEQGIAVAGYISMPKSREVMSLVKLGLCRFTQANCIPCHAVYDSFPCKEVDTLLDTHLMGELLRCGERSTLFASSSNIVAEYPEHLKPWFCYLHVGAEIVRLEMPAYVVQDEVLVSRVCSIVLDQVEKGGGYPVVLAEAHEQAVVKAPDRDFFYQLVAKIGLQRNRKMSASLKSITKRSMRF